MKKTIYIARVADDNSDAYRAYFTREEAAKAAEMYAAHLTASERTTHTVSIEAYSIECADTDTAEEAFREALVNDEVADPTEYEEV